MAAQEDRLIQIKESELKRLFEDATPQTLLDSMSSNWTQFIIDHCAEFSTHFLNFARDIVFKTSVETYRTEDMQSMLDVTWKELKRRKNEHKI